jgi:hypothetical protein
VFGNKKKTRGVEVDVTRYLEAAVLAARETLTHSGCLLEEPDNELTLDAVLTAGPEIVCANAGLPADIIAWVRREATYRTAVAYARHRDQHIARGDDTAVQAMINELIREPPAVQAGFLNMAAVLP